MKASNQRRIMASSTLCCIAVAACTHAIKPYLHIATIKHISTLPQLTRLGASLLPILPRRLRRRLMLRAAAPPGCLQLAGLTLAAQAARGLQLRRGIGGTGKGQGWCGGAVAQCRGHAENGACRRLNLPAPD